MLITAWVGMFLASPLVTPWNALIYGTVGIAFAAAAAAIINHLLDRHIDRFMSRTAARPIAAGRVHPNSALLFACILAILAGYILIKKVNATTSSLTFATLLGYAFLYTLYLKRATPQNIVIGGLSGAMPPLLGWSAVSGNIHHNGILLVLIIFVWTPPHFWALAIYRAKDYSAAKIPMLPVTHGIPYTKLNILLYTILLLAVSCLPFVTELCGIMYLCSALILGIIFLIYAVRLFFATGIQEHKLAIKTFNFSIIYLTLLFIMLLVDNKLGFFNE